MRSDLVGILCCPATHRALRPASAARLAAVNRAIDAGSVALRNGRRWESALKAALVTDDEALLYRIDDGIPVLLEGEAILLDEQGG